MLALRYRHHRTAPIPSKQSEDAPTTTETANHVGPTATTHEKPHRPSIARNAQQTPRQTTQLHHPQPPTYKHITRKTGLARPESSSPQCAEGARYLQRLRAG